MYLLTCEYRDSADHEWKLVLTLTRGETTFFDKPPEDWLRNVELFERRGNDWIRIRPEEG